MPASATHEPIELMEEEWCQLDMFEPDPLDPVWGRIAFPQGQNGWTTSPATLTYTGTSNVVNGTASLIYQFTQ